MFTKLISSLCLVSVLTACQQLPTPQGRYQQLSANNTQQPLLLVLQDGKLSGFTGCNNAMGTYSVDKGTLVVSQLASTMKACIPAAMQREQLFSQFLQNRPTMMLDGKILTLTKNDIVYQFSQQTVVD